jgi:hypothetical protein
LTTSFLFANIKCFEANSGKELAMAGNMREALSQAGLVAPDEQKEAQKRETRQANINRRKQLRKSATTGFDRHGICLLERKSDSRR